MISGDATNPNFVMVIKASTQPDEFMKARGLEYRLNESEVLQTDAFGLGEHLYLHRAAVGVEKIFIFWVGALRDENQLIFAGYLGLRGITLGSSPAFESKKAWTDPTDRRRGIGRRLLEEVIRLGPMVSDSDGLTLDAYRLWNRFPMRWWDIHLRNFVQPN